MLAVPHAYEKRYISTKPVNIIQNIFGGGNVQRDNIAIASLEIRHSNIAPNTVRSKTEGGRESRNGRSPSPIADTNKISPTPTQVLK